MIPVTSFANKKVALFGLGGSGLASALALKAGGADVIAFDDSAESLEKARAAGIATEDLRTIDWSKIAALVLAPGVPLTHPAPHWSVELAKSARVEVIGDIELFCRERRKLAPHSPFVAITGTNGKSTTTALIHHLLVAAGRSADLGGNIGTAVLTLKPPSTTHAHVVECSSYQIDLAPTLDPRVGILINVSEDHLDRHGTIAHYAAVKERLVAGVPTGGTAVIGVDDEWCAAAAQRVAAKGRPVVRISTRKRLPDGIFVDKGVVIRAAAGKTEVIATLDGIGSLRGLAQRAERGLRVRGGAGAGPQRGADSEGPAIVSRTGPSHGAGRPPGQGVVRQRFQGDQRGFHGAGAGLVHRHVLDRRRQAQNRRHHLARSVFPAHPQGLSDRRGRGGVRPDARWQGRL